MKYVISGKKETFQLYAKSNNLKIETEVKYANTREIFNKITDIDTIVLLQGWWGRRWAKDAVSFYRYRMFRWTIWRKRKRRYFESEKFYRKI